MPSINVVTSPFVSAGWTTPLVTRDVPFVWRTIIALTIAYSSFIAEIFRAGIQAVDQGQIEAAKALGLSPRPALPPRRLSAGNPCHPAAAVERFHRHGQGQFAGFRSSGVADISQLAKLYYSANFRYFETLSILAFIYLLLTIGLSLLLRQLEAWMRRRSGSDRSAFSRMAAGQPPGAQM